jgi:hypothetical protein
MTPIDFVYDHLGCNHFSKGDSTMRTRLFVAILFVLFAWGNVSAETCTENLTVESKPIELIKCLQQLEKNMTYEFQKRELNALPIGTIVASMLEFEKFQNVAGNAWKPADGRKVSAKSGYAKLTGNTVLPDLRGMFLRGLNQFDPRTGSRRDKYKDPDGGGRQAGSLQNDATSLPKNKRRPFKGIAEAAGEHSHVYFKALSVGGRSGSEERASSEASTTGLAGDHTHTVLITSGGDSETRPVNIAVFYYIKIN